MKKKIFVLENDEAILEIVTHLLNHEGYNVKALRVEDEIFEQIKNYSPDIILLDIVKPSEEGTMICRTLKADTRTKHIPVIVLSTHKKVAETIKNVCADDVISKPFDIDELINTIKIQLTNFQ